MVAVVDYGMGNLRSVLNALHHLGAPAALAATPAELEAADRIILPGVGSFRRAMENIRAQGLEAALHRQVRERGVPLLGICLGMQLLATRGTEDGNTEGLDFVRGVVERFPDVHNHDDALRVPHIGFDAVSVRRPVALFDGLPDGSDFYFVHSYHLRSDDPQAVVGTCARGTGEFVAAVENGRVCGTQYHPEKSQSNGLAQLRNFLDKY